MASDGNESHAGEAPTQPAEDAMNTSAVQPMAATAATTDVDTTAEQENAPKTPKITYCGICHTNASKYKCPRCYMPYCSIACNKIHRENHPDDPPKPALPPPPLQPQTQGTPLMAGAAVDPANPFRSLETSDKLQMLFDKYPKLPDQLLQIHAATLPPSDQDAEPRGIPSLMLQGLPRKKDNWNHDLGVRNGKAALRRARKADGTMGQAIREYSELVLHLLNTDSKEDVDELLRRQMAQQDTQLIERLIKEEDRRH